MTDAAGLPTRTTGRAAAHLFLLAAASLAFELAIIRFTSAEVLYLGYFSNFILLSAFVGLGLGFLAAPRAESFGGATATALPFLVALVKVAHFDADAIRNKSGLFFFGNVSGASGLPGAALLVVLFLTTAAFFVGLGQRLGRAFGALPPLRAYTFDVAGSLLGIVLFTLQSASGASPVEWIVLASALLALALMCDPRAPDRRGAVVAGVTGLASVLLLLAPADRHLTLWSTYQKLEYDPPRILANGIDHQTLNPAEVAAAGFYGAPYAIRARSGGKLDDVLIVGAGSGTDVAVALRSGARSVDAVEIDPDILAIGRQFHPDAPYDDPRVHAHVDDGRAFLRSTDKRYDVVVFALPDSLIRVAALSNVRLESYLFTTEAFADVKRHLKDDGVFVLYNQYRWDWLRARIAATLEATWGSPPVALTYATTTVFFAGPQTHGTPIAYEGFEGLATDDWPHLYMQRRSMPWMYLGMIALFVLASIAGVGALGPPGALRRPDGAFFFMGAAFLLLETKTIATFALLFGTTWLVNALTFAGVLTSVLLANLTVRRLGRRGRPLLFALLFGSLAVAYACPPSALLAVSSMPLRYALAVLLAFAPVFFANLLFSEELEGARSTTGAFGWNLLGAVVGGGLEYLSLVVGQRNLLVIAAVAYALVAWTLRRSPRATALA